MSISDVRNWIKYYDLIYGDHVRDLNFYKKEAKKISGKILEIGVGTGRIYIPLLKMGLDAYGIDVNEEKVNILRNKTQEMGLKPKLFSGDMKDFKINEKFSLIITPFNIFLFLLTSDDQIQTLTNLKSHLRTDGKLIIDFIRPDSFRIVNEYGKEKIEIIEKEGIRLVRRKITCMIDSIEQIRETKSHIFQNDKLVSEEYFQLTHIYKKEFELLLRIAGFKKWKVYGDFNYQKLTSKSERMVWVIHNLLKDIGDGN